MKKQKSFLDTSLGEHILVYGWAYLIIVIAIGALIYFGIIHIPYLTNENEWCKLNFNNFDKCVCEKYNYYFDDENEVISSDIPIKTELKCLNYRKKTPEELDLNISK